MKNAELTDPWRQKADHWLPGIEGAGGGKNGDLLFNGHEIFFWTDEMFWN